MRPSHILGRLLTGALLIALSFPLEPATASLVAQARPSDPITGTWSGYIGRSEAQPSAVKIELVVATDGKVSGTVTGPQLTPGDITSGTFDAATGALKFTVVIRDAMNGAGGAVSFDGAVVHDTASGKMLLGGQNGVFKVTKDGPGARLASSASSAKAPARATGDAAVAARRSFVEVADWITRAAALVPADKYSYRPVATVRTFGQIVGHVVDGSHYYCGRAAGGTAQWSDATEKGVAAKPALVQALKQALAACIAAYDGASQIGPLVDNVGHSSLHYGNMVTYIRMLGLVPPSS